MNLKLNTSKMLAQFNDHKKKENSYGKDPNIWKLQTNEKKEGGALIRFLPGKDLERLPFVIYKQHSFKFENGQMFYSICPTSVGQPCPVCEANRRLWQIDKDLASKRNAKKQYISNILVVKELAPIGNPENEGKVFKFVFGKQIYGLLEAKLSPNSDLGEEPLLFFDFENGADFQIQSIKQGDFPNYAVNSKFRSPSPIKKDTHHLSIEEIYEKIWHQDDLFDFSSVPEYEEIQEKYHSLKNLNLDDFEDQGKKKKTKQRNQKVEEEEIKDENIADEDDDKLFQEIMDDI